MPSSTYAALSALHPPTYSLSNSNFEPISLSAHYYPENKKHLLPSYLLPLPLPTPRSYISSTITENQPHRFTKANMNENLLPSPENVDILDFSPVSIHYNFSCSYSSSTVGVASLTKTIRVCGWCDTTSTSQWRVGPTTGSPGEFLFY